MSDFEKAARDAVEAAENTELTRQIAAILAAQQIVNAQQPAPAPQPAARREFHATQWLVIGGVVTVAGTVAAFVALALAVAIIAVAGCGTVALLILRQLWADLRKGA